MSQDLENIKIICPECLGDASDCTTCYGNGIIKFSTLVFGFDYFSQKNKKLPAKSREFFVFDPNE